jgi:hypothetical protein
MFHTKTLRSLTMTAKHNNSREHHIEQILKAASKREEAKDFCGAALLLGKAFEQTAEYFGKEEVTPHLLHAEFHLHWASLHQRFGSQHLSIEAALKGLHVMNQVVAVPPEHDLWQHLMGFMPHH